MKLRTEISIDSSGFELDYQSELLFLGSCFSENVGQLLKERKFKSMINPFGISYNPISISKNILKLFDNEPIDEASLAFANGRYFHFDYHGSNNKNEKQTYVSSIEAKKAQLRDSVENLDCMFISLGTAHVFEHKDFGIVNNCHKSKAQLFERRLLRIEEIQKALESMIDALRARNKKLKVVFTVSPIRHIRDGLIKDRLSKSVLIASLTKLIAHPLNHYFPSYEILTDDLRDYRFYKEDLIHPNKMAIQYIWNHFKNCYLSSDTQEKLIHIEKIVSGLSHRAIDVESQEHQKFLESLLNLIAKHGDLNFDEEKKWIKNQII